MKNIKLCCHDLSRSCSSFYSVHYPILVWGGIYCFKIKIALLLLFTLSINIVDGLANKTNNTSSSSSVSWSQAASWAEGIAPPIANISGEHITINGYVTVSNSDIALAGGTMSFGANSDGFNLTVNNGGLLVVEGDIDFDNKAMNLIINSGGIVLILGAFSSTNFIDIQDEGVLVITGDMAFGGAQSTFDNSGTGNLYVGGTVTGNTDAENEDQPIQNLDDGSGHDDPNLFNFIVSSMAGMTISESSGSTIVTELGGTDTFDLVLDVEPESNVVILVTSNNVDEFTVDKATLTFTTGNWDVAQTIAVSGVDDAIDDGDIVGSVTLSVDDINSDNAYDLLADQSVNVTNQDDDNFGITVSTISNNTKEDGTSATFTVVLDSEPTGNVEIGVSSDDTTEGTVSTSALTFTSSDWLTPQTVTIIGVNDAIDDGDVAFNVVLAAANSSDTNYNNLIPPDVAVINEDDDGNASPVITGQAIAVDTNEDENISILLDHLTVTDIDNTYPSDFSLFILGGENYSVEGDVITPTKNFNGTLSVKVFVNDGQDNSNHYNLIIKVLSVNDAPLAHADVKEIEFGNLISGNLLANDSDVDKNELLLNEVTPYIEGFTFEPNGDYKFENNATIEEFILNYEVCDDGIPSLCATSVFTITVKDGDFDQDGIPDSVELFYDDVDGDGDQEYIDRDSDNDNIDDIDEGGGNPAEPLDTDLDGLPDFVDFDSDGDGKLDKDEGQGDCDNDTIANYIDEEEFCEEMIATGAFSPNGDGKNDKWIIPGINEFPDNTVIIFNRWGDKVFQIDGYDNNINVWRGEINTGLRTGGDQAAFSTYYYVVDLRNGSKPMSGSILLVR